MKAQVSINNSESVAMWVCWAAPSKAYHQSAPQPSHFPNREHENNPRQNVPRGVTFCKQLWKIQLCVVDAIYNWKSGNGLRWEGWGLDSELSRSSSGSSELALSLGFMFLEMLSLHPRHMGDMTFLLTQLLQEKPKHKYIYNEITFFFRH